MVNRVVDAVEKRMQCREREETVLMGVKHIWVSLRLRFIPSLNYIVTEFSLKPITARFMVPYGAGTAVRD